MRLGSRVISPRSDSASFFLSHTSLCGGRGGTSGLLWIALHGNQITSDKVGKKVFSKLKHLERLYLDHNNLTRIPSPLPRSLRELHLDHNQISRVPNNALEGLENLTALYLHHNEIQDEGKRLWDHLRGTVCMACIQSPSPVVKVLSPVHSHHLCSC